MVAMGPWPQLKDTTFQRVTTTVAVAFNTTVSVASTVKFTTILTARPTACPARPVPFDLGNVFDRNYCWDRVKAWLSDPVNWLNEDCLRRYFHDGPEVDVENPILSLTGCRAFCGEKQEWYKDPGPRVVDWIVPILFLLCNIDLSPIDRKRLFAIIHALGDPIDTIWSLLDKLFALYRCRHIARKFVDEGERQLEKRNAADVRFKDVTEVGETEIPEEDVARAETVDCIAGVQEEQGEAPDGGESNRAAVPVLTRADDGPASKEDRNAARDRRARVTATVFTGFEEIWGHYSESHEHPYRTAAQTLGAAGPVNENSSAFQSWRNAAVTLVDGRTTEFLRTGFAISLYLLQVVSEFIPKISGDSNQFPGGRIGAALLLSWLIPVTLLSNLMGGFTSRRGCLETMVRLVETTSHPAQDSNRDAGEIPRLLPPGCLAGYFDRQPSMGAMYTFRPFKLRHALKAKGWEKAVRLSLIVVAFLRVVFGFVPCFYIHWMANPPGFSCRHFWVPGVFVLWILSALLTSASEWLLRIFDKEEWHFSFMLIKDICIGFGSLTMVWLSVVGLFNSCVCWSLLYWIGERRAYVTVNNDPWYLAHGDGDYAIMVGVFVGLQLLLVAVTILLLWKSVRGVRWRESEKRKEWERMMMLGGQRVQAGNLFEFWTQLDGSQRAGGP